jgi:hypothetical protein
MCKKRIWNLYLYICRLSTEARKSQGHLMEDKELVLIRVTKTSQPFYPRY